MQKLRAIVYLHGDGLPEGFRSGYPCFPLEDVSIGALAAWALAAEDALLLAARDADIGAARSIKLAAAAYVRPGEMQRYEGAPVLIEGFDEVDDVFLERVYRRCHGLPWTILRTRRCIVRELSLSDLPALYELYEKEGVTWRRDAQGQRVPGFIEPLFPYAEEEEYQRAYIRNMYGFYGYGMWLVFSADGCRLIGRAGLEHREYPEGTELEIGYLIAPEQRGQGIAAEVCRAIVEYARGLGFCRLNALTEPQNAAGIALLQRLGFSYLEDTDVSGSRTRRYVYWFS